MKDWLGQPKKRLEKIFQEYGQIIFVTILFLICLSLIIEIYSLLIPQKLRVTFLDVGQGDAIFIQTPSGKSMLVDGGPNDLIRTRLGDQLSYFNRGLDVMLATHPDADHVTGLIPVLEKYKVETIVLSPAVGHTQVFDDLNMRVKQEQAETYVAKTGDVIDFQDGVTATILYPGENYQPKKNDTNEASVSLLLRYGEETFLLTGDLPKVKEPELIGSGFLKFAKKITVYKAGHHGSKSSSGEELLTYIHPEYAVISAGKDNKYGHPNIETLELLQKYAKEIISTIDRGTISFVTDGRRLEVVTSK